MLKSTRMKSFFPQSGLHVQTSTQFLGSNYDEIYNVIH